MKTLKGVTGVTKLRIKTNLVKLIETLKKTSYFKVISNVRLSSTITLSGLIRRLDALQLGHSPKANVYLDPLVR